MTHTLHARTTPTGHDARSRASAVRCGVRTSTSSDSAKEAPDQRSAASQARWEKRRHLSMPP
jgi:hypothetical protein